MIAALVIVAVTAIVWLVSFRTVAWWIRGLLLLSSVAVYALAWLVWAAGVYLNIFPNGGQTKLELLMLAPISLPVVYIACITAFLLQKKPKGERRSRNALLFVGSVAAAAIAAGLSYSLHVGAGSHHHIDAVVTFGVMLTVVTFVVSKDRDWAFALLLLAAALVLTMPVVLVGHETYRVLGRLWHLLPG